MNKCAFATIHSKAADLPEVLQTIPQPPNRLFIRSTSFCWDPATPVIAIVGSRKITPYGKTITMQLAEALAKAGVLIVSGLALGVDAIAHRAALQAGGKTVAILAGGLDAIYPASNYRLAQDIIEQGGALMSEYPDGTPTYPHHFIARNRIVSGLSRAILITEATEKSGTLHTARFALEQGRDVFAVPGNITSPQSEGCNNLIKSGAIPATTPDDILHTLGIQPATAAQKPLGATPEEQHIIDLLLAGETDGTQLLERSGLDAIRFNQSLTMLEITGKIRSLGANMWSL